MKQEIKSDPRRTASGKRIPRAHRKRSRGDTYAIRLERRLPEARRPKPSRALQDVQRRIAYELAPCPDDLVAECPACHQFYRRECFCTLIPERTRLQEEASKR